MGYTAGLGGGAEIAYTRPLSILFFLCAVVKLRIRTTVVFVFVRQSKLLTFLR